ncbi:MAG TPA: LLM class F420-dependent oxidoreductase [Gammaproteobacteria bacterium]|nr:LLM class F420-dependent oxidoreductase [Gammaproteobacteria bacterium]
MKLGLMAGYSPAQIKIPMEQILEAERLGFDSVWTAEAYGSDALTTAAWVLAKTSRIKVGTAIVQMPARTPTCTAMSAMTLSEMSGGRFILGIGPSGPGVIEGWHGVAYGRPLTRTREYVDILRKIFSRREKLEHEGYHYQIPYRGKDAKGVGRPIKSILHTSHPIPIYTAAITPAGLRCAGEVANGVFPIWMNPQRFDLLGPFIEEGLALAGGEKTLADFDVAPMVSIVIGDDLAECRTDVKAHLALYIGGMGPPGHNFYNDYASRMGYAAEARQIQQLYLTGKKVEAAQAVPDQLVDDCALVGPAERIRERLKVWKEAGSRGHVGSMLVGGATIDALRLLAEELL